MGEQDFLKSEEAKGFVRENAQADINQLLLNPPPRFRDHISLLVDQILSRKKAKGKLDQWLEKPNIIFPPPLSIEQSSSSTTANYKSQIVKGEQLIDLTGGMGVDCLALSKNFKEATYVERSPWLCELFQWNSSWFDTKVQIENRSAEDFIGHLGPLLNEVVFYIDPARRSNGKKTVLLEDCEPNVLNLIPSLLEKNAKVLMKTSPLLDIKSVLRSLSNTSEVHVVAVKNEVKELLFHFQPNTSTDPKIVTVNLGTDQQFEFYPVNEVKASSTYGNPSNFLYEPNSAVLKAGAFKLVGSRFGLSKLDENSHLYSSESLAPSFPGKSFEIRQHLKKPDLKHLANTKLNVISRNHPMSAEQIKKKYKVKDGGSSYLIATRVLGKPTILLCDLVTS